jgi:hypothetical protein
MKRFWKDRKGSTPIWAAFLILILFTVSAVVYSAVMIYAKSQACETEVQRAATVTVDKNMENANVRDLILDVPAESAVESFYVNMTETVGIGGWMLEPVQKMTSLSIALKTDGGRRRKNEHQAHAASPCPGI